MIDIVNIQYQQKTSTDLNKLGMREMRARLSKKMTIFIG